MPPAKSEFTKDGWIRFRRELELQVRIERISLLYGVEWTELAGIVLEQFAGEQERLNNLPKGYEPALPVPRYRRPDQLPNSQLSRYKFLTNKLKVLHLAQTAEARADAARLEYKPEEWT